jgi:hypothetical protein
MRKIDRAKETKKMRKIDRAKERKKKEREGGGEEK